MEGDAARRYRDKAVEDLDRGARGGDHQAARRNIIIPYRNIAEAVQLPALGRRDAAASCQQQRGYPRSEEHTSELQSLMRISYAVFCLKKKKQKQLKDTLT